MLPLLERICNAFGVSGYEGPVREVIRAEIADLVDEVRVDALGNLIAVRGPRGAQSHGQRVLLAAHMDEIGIIVSHIDDNGFARFASLGYVNPNTLLGARVQFANGVEGTFGAEGRPLPNDKPDLQAIFLDVGATSRADCPVQVGDVAVFRHRVVPLAGGQRLLSPNMDDRAGVALLVETLRALGDSPYTVLAVFTVQEEVSIAGAAGVAFGLEPDLAIALDVTPAGDTPKAKPVTVQLGAGPAIGVKDAGVVAHAGVKRALVEAAQRAGIPYQMDIGHFGTTDAYAMQASRTGVPVGTLSIPARYIHTPTQMVDRRDLDGGVTLLTTLLAEPIDLDKPT